MNILMNMAIEYGNYGHEKLKNGHLVIEKCNGQNMVDGFGLSGQRRISRLP